MVVLILFGDSLVHGLLSPSAWTPWEDAQLRAGFAADIPTAQVALIIGRPHAGVYSRADKLGIKHASTPKGWTNAEIERAIELVQAGHTYTQIGTILGTEGFATRTKSSLQALMQRTGQGKCRISRSGRWQN